MWDRSRPAGAVDPMWDGDMKRAAAADDKRQGMLFDDAPPAPRSSDDGARREMMELVDRLAAAKAHPWSARLLGWKLRTFDLLAQRLTPLDAAALRARLDAELARLGLAED
jgi:hypothetical protein